MKEPGRTTDAFSLHRNTGPQATESLKHRSAYHLTVTATISSDAAAAGKLIARLKAEK